MKISAGIDCGSRTVKIVLFDAETKKIIDYSIHETSIFPSKLISEKYSDMLIKHELRAEEVNNIFSTGYGRNSISFASDSKSEIICHAKGCNYFLPQVKTIIDIGGQDSKVIAINDKGKVLDFVMNDKCAAGTGRFLEKVAQILNCDLAKMNDIAVFSDKDLTISSTCVVFAESEIIGLLSQGEKPENIINAVYNSIVKRIRSQAGTIHLEKPFAFVGGVAHHHLMKKIFEFNFDTEIFSPQDPSITGALGAAILAAEEVL